jgi:hypothetical protein
MLSSGSITHVFSICLTRILFSGRMREIDTSYLFLRINGSVAGVYREILGWEWVKVGMSLFCKTGH